MNQLFPAFPPLAFVDIETTGGSAVQDRVTEVAVVTYADGATDHWSSLVNPETAIPPFIQRLTGIDDAMVRGQPRFADIAHTLRSQLEGKFFVAHNARFDHGFLAAEFQRLGLDFSPQVLCTVKLSRRLFPAQARHSLDAVIAAHGLRVRNRHRAMADADALLQFWRHLESTSASGVLEKAVKALVQRPRIAVPA